MKINVVDVAAFRERGVEFGRLDAEFVDGSLLGFENRLVDEFAAEPLAKMTPQEPAIFASPQNASSTTRKYVAIDDIDPLDGFVFHQDVPEEELPSRAKFLLNGGDLVLSNVRPERGAVGILIPSQGGSIGSSGLTVVRLPNEKQRNVTFAYLRTRAARMQLVRRSRGSMYPAVTKDDIPEILVPKFVDEVRTKANKEVEASLAARIQFAAAKAEQAAFVDDYLSSTLGPPPPDIVMDIAGPLSLHIASSDEFFDAHACRFDAEFFRQEHIDYATRLKNLQNVTLLGSEYEAFSGANLNKGDETLYRLRQAQLTAFGLVYSGVEELENVRASQDARIASNDVLIACTAHEPHYVGRRVDIVDQQPPELEGKIVPVADVMIIRSKSVNPNPPASFLASFLRSAWGLTQFQRLNRGVRGGHVYGQDVEAFVLIPRPPKKWLTEFEDRQTKIRAARRESMLHTQKAVQAVSDWLGC